MPDAFPFELPEHAAVVIRERGIRLTWVQHTIETPAKVESDAADPELRHALATVPEFGDRVLRVIYNHSTRPWRIVSVYFDRSMKGRL